MFLNISIGWFLRRRCSLLNVQYLMSTSTFRSVGLRARTARQRVQSTPLDDFAKRENCREVINSNVSIKCTAVPGSIDPTCLCTVQVK